jgi:hypothetical protein
MSGAQALLALDETVGKQQYEAFRAGETSLRAPLMLAAA